MGETTNRPWIVRVILKQLTLLLALVIAPVVAVAVPLCLGGGFSDSGDPLVLWYKAYVIVLGPIASGFWAHILWMAYVLPNVPGWRKDPTRTAVYNAKACAVWVFSTLLSLALSLGYAFCFSRGVLKAAGVQALFLGAHVAIWAPALLVFSVLALRGQQRRRETPAEAALRKEWGQAVKIARGTEHADLLKELERDGPDPRVNYAELQRRMADEYLYS